MKKQWKTKKTNGVSAVVFIVINWSNKIKWVTEHHVYQLRRGLQFYLIFSFVFIRFFPSYFLNKILFFLEKIGLYVGGV